MHRRELPRSVEVENLHVRPPRGDRSTPPDQRRRQRGSWCSDPSNASDRIVPHAAPRGGWAPLVIDVRSAYKRAPVSGDRLEATMPRWDTLTVDGHPMRTYLDLPRGAGTLPAVVVAQHGPGVDEFIQDRVRALAARGYLAAAPDLYHRQPPEPDMMTRIGRLRDAEIVADVDATVAHVRALAGVTVTDV